MRYGITISYSDVRDYEISPIYEWLEKKSISFIGIRHLGEKKDHPHHHILTEFKQYTKTCDLRRAIVMAKLLKNITRFSLKIESVDPKKFGGYLFHENPNSIVRIHPISHPYNLLTLRE